MAVSKFYLGYKQLSKAVFEWQAADRTALLAAFMVMDVFSHWLWCLFVWYRRDAYSNYIDMNWCVCGRCILTMDVQSFFTS